MVPLLPLLRPGCYSHGTRATCISGGSNLKGLELTELAQSDSESSVGMHSTSVVEPSAEAASTRQQLLTALSLLKHLAHNSPDACRALVDADIMHTARRYALIEPCSWVLSSVILLSSASLAFLIV